jgi:hypothetical protein
LRLSNLLLQNKNGLEVDFILYGPEGLIAIEVKRSAHVRTKKLTGFIFQSQM